jgi:hypothetical protein
VREGEREREREIVSSPLDPFFFVGEERSKRKQDREKLTQRKTRQRNNSQALLAPSLLFPLSRRTRERG